MLKFSHKNLRWIFTLYDTLCVQYGKIYTKTHTHTIQKNQQKKRQIGHPTYNFLINKLKKENIGSCKVKQT